MTDFIFLDSKITVNGDCSHEIKRCLLLGRKAMTKLDSVLKNRDITLLTKDLCSQSYGFSRSHVQMWELDHKEGWAPKNWCFWTVVLDKTLESPLDCKDIKPVNPKGNQPWAFIGKMVAEADTPILWWSNWRVYSLEKTLMLGKIEGRRRRWWQRMRRLNSITDSRDINEFEQTLGDGEGQGSLECCSSWSRKESDTTEWLNNWNKEDNCNNKS